MLKIRLGNDIYSINLKRLWQVTKEFLGIVLFLISIYILCCMLFVL